MKPVCELPDAHVKLPDGPANRYWFAGQQLHAIARPTVRG